MKICVKNNVEANVYEVYLKFKEFGSSTITEEEEKELINDFAPKFRMRDIDFTGKYKYDSDKKTVVKYEPIATPDESRVETEEPSIGEVSATIMDEQGKILLEEDNGEFVEVRLVVNDKEVTVDDTLELKCVVRADQILETETGKALNTKGLVAQAKVKLFEDKIVDKIEGILKDLKEQRTKFEGEREVVI